MIDETEIVKLQQRVKELEKRKRIKPKKTPTETKLGAYLVARDVNHLYSSRRYDDKAAAVAEIKRLAKKMNDRFLLLKVVAVLDKRAKESGQRHDG